MNRVLAIVGLLSLIFLVASVGNIQADPVSGVERSSQSRAEKFHALDDGDMIPAMFPARRDRIAGTGLLGTAMSEGFEGAWPSAGWGLLDDSPNDGGEYLWAARDCHPRSGRYAAMTFGGGMHGQHMPCSANYPNNISTWAAYGPFDLSQATSASLTFHVWGLIDGPVAGECPRDYLYVGSSVDGRNFLGGKVCGDATDGPDGNGYYLLTLSLAQRLSERQVWIGFEFTSDGWLGYGGFLVDDVTLQVSGGARAVATPTVTPNPRFTPVAWVDLPLVWNERLPLPTATATPVARSTNTVVPTPTSTLAPTPTNTPSVSVEVEAWVSNSSPSQYSTVRAYGKITQGGKGIAGVPMHTTWRYKTTTSYCDGSSGSDGVASCSRSIGRATKGHYVSISVRFTYEGQSYTASTGFTPR